MYDSSVLLYLVFCLEGLVTPPSLDIGSLDDIGGQMHLPMFTSATSLDVRPASALVGLAQEAPSALYETIKRGDPVELGRALLTSDRELKRARLYIAELEGSLSQAVLPIRHRKGEHLGARGDFKLWRSRNYGHASAETLLKILSAPGDKTLVFRSERRGGAAHFITGRQFVASRLEQASKWVVLVVRTDAFSSSVARTDEPKLQVT